MLARYGAALALPAEMPPEPERERLRDLMDRRDQLVEMRKSERIRLAQPHADWLEESLSQVIDALDRQIEVLKARLEALLACAPSLEAQKAIVCSAPGVGPVTAKVLLAHLPELGRRGTGQAGPACHQRACRPGADRLRFRHHARQTLHLGRAKARARCALRGSPCRLPLRPVQGRVPSHARQGKTSQARHHRHRKTPPRRSQCSRQGQQSIPLLTSHNTVARARPEDDGGEVVNGGGKLDKAGQALFVPTPRLRGVLAFTSLPSGDEPLRPVRTDIDDGALAQHLFRQHAAGDRP
jgi:hypothetical protein